MNDYIITVFTPTYNRANTLNKLFNSLEKQTMKRFVWLIVDDGSTDHTVTLVDSFKKSASFEIIYLKKKNGGKHSAHNLAVNNSYTELFYTVDSDDYLPNDSIETIVNTWDEKKDEKIAGIIALKAYSNCKVIGTKFPDGIERGKLLDMYRLYGKVGDTALIFRTSILRKYLYPIFDGEKMLPDAYIYTQINCEKDMYIMNTVLCYCEYREDGLTANGTALALKSPKGYAAYKYLMMKCEPTRYWRFKSLIGYVMYSVLSKDIKKPIKNIGFIKTILALPLSALVYLRLKLMIARKNTNSKR